MNEIEIKNKKDDTQGRLKENSSKLNNLIDEMKNVTAHMEKYYSLKYAFFRGIIYGLGFILGTTIVAGILLTTMNLMFDELPFQEAIENKIQSK